MQDIIIATPTLVGYAWIDRVIGNRLCAYPEIIGTALVSMPWRNAFRLVRTRQGV